MAAEAAVRRPARSPAFAHWRGRRYHARPVKVAEKGAHMPVVRVKDNEPFDIALRRFKRSCEKAGILTEARRREFYEKPTTMRKRKAAAAVKRYQKKLAREAMRRLQGRPRRH